MKVPGSFIIRFTSDFIYPGLLLTQLLEIPHLLFLLLNINTAILLSKWPAVTVALIILILLLVLFLVQCQNLLKRATYEQYHYIIYCMIIQGQTYWSQQIQ